MLLLLLLCCCLLHNMLHPLSGRLDRERIMRSEWPEAQRVQGVICSKKTLGEARPPPTGYNFCLELISKERTKTQ